MSMCRDRIETTAKLLADVHGHPDRWMEYIELANTALCLPMLMPKHVASASITHNDHTSNYMTVKEEEESSPELYGDCWVSEESRQYALEHNELWTLQWYPHTPNGFEVLHAGRWEDIAMHLLGAGDAER